MALERMLPMFMLRTQRHPRLILLLSILASCAILHAAPVDYRDHGDNDDDDIQKTLEHLARSGNMKSGSDLLQNGASTDQQPQQNGETEFDDGREGERWVPQGRDGEKMMELGREGQQGEESGSAYNQQGEHGENESDQQALDHRSKEEQLDQRTDDRQKNEVAEEVHTDEDQKDQPSDEEHMGDQNQEANDNQKSQTKDEDYPVGDHQDNKSQPSDEDHLEENTNKPEETADQQQENQSQSSDKDQEENSDQQTDEKQNGRPTAEEQSEMTSDQHADENQGQPSSKDHEENADQKIDENQTTSEQKTEETPTGQNKGDNITQLPGQYSGNPDPPGPENQPQDGNHPEKSDRGKPHDEESQDENEINEGKVEEEQPLKQPDTPIDEKSDAEKEENHYEDKNEDPSQIDEKREENKGTEKESNRNANEGNEGIESGPNTEGEKGVRDGRGGIPPPYSEEVNEANGTTLPPPLTREGSENTGRDGQPYGEESGNNQATKKHKDDVFGESDGQKSGVQKTAADENGQLEEATAEAMPLDATMPPINVPFSHTTLAPIVGPVDGNDSSVPDCSDNPGEWGAWLEVGACSADCGAFGMIQRVRECLSFQSGRGCPCVGEYKVTERCNIGVCQYPLPSCYQEYNLIYLDGKFACGPQKEEIIKRFLDESNAVKNGHPTRPKLKERVGRTLFF